ncbi:Protoheme IX farnesyltransferase, mitochondrial [Grifola frondosa]|uniref:Protoheme IX farnesyltransferase, mitochondrial n=1 Tax=Grifola frondosa TaxID=5627 RepID=A0A1C7M8F7_GRIFR|nr:Protoheme IX farnesyltransferase, mitochondrial [Grifola frondosa]
MSSPLVSYICRNCAANISRFAQTRSASTLAKRPPAKFSSFFLHNNVWAHQPNNATPLASRPTPQTVRGNVVAATSPSLPAYREAEVLTARRLLKIYAQLSKSRLTVLVVLTAMSGVALSPLPTSVPVLLATAIGTALCSASANTLNQLQEVPFDAQMARTRNRPLVRHAVSPLHATGFAIVTGISGPAILWAMVNPTTAFLGAANIALYSGLYTWLKRKSILNTWVGAVVGAIPPLMGWAACGGHLLPSAAHPVVVFLPSFLTSVPMDVSLMDNPLAPFALFMFLFSWQFPHFNSLSHFVRDSYAQAGYKMLCVISPSKNALVSLRYALLFLPICSILVPLSGLTTWTFALTSLVPNLICIEAAWKFWKKGGEKEARRVFQHSLWFMPVVLGLMMFHKRGMDWGSWFGLGEAEKAKEEHGDSA